jgi:uroporphyrinogen-III synthase
MRAADAQPLAGVRVLVTRPRGQAEHIARLIEQAGGVAIRFPLIEIVAPADPAPLHRLVDRLDEFDLAIFVSANAVEYGLAAVQTRRAGWPARLPVAAVGEATARALRERGFTNVLAPAGRFNTEALLELPALRAVAGQRIAIFRGQVGRELLAEELRARGARVEYAECYRREPPSAEPGSLPQRFRRGEIDIVILTSVETAHNLRLLLGDAAQQLSRFPAVVVSERIAQACRETGLQPIVAREASDEAVVDALQAWRAAQKTL